MPLISETELEKLLGRQLTTVEHDNYESYIDIATKQLEDLLCVDLSYTEDAQERTYITRKNYRTVYTDFYRELTEVKKTDTVVETDKYTKKQNDRFNGDWYNIVEFGDKADGNNVVVKAKWGFAEDAAPAEFLILLAQLFNQVSINQKATGQVKSKKIEDFTVTYEKTADLETVLGNNSSTLAKYSQCQEGEIRNGCVQPFYDY